jgi:hypothetical protein
VQQLLRGTHGQEPIRRHQQERRAHLKGTVPHPHAGGDGEHHEESEPTGSEGQQPRDTEADQQAEASQDLQPPSEHPEVPESEALEFGHHRARVETEPAVAEEHDERDDSADFEGGLHASGVTFDREDPLDPPSR